MEIRDKARRTKRWSSPKLPWGGALIALAAVVTITVLQLSKKGGGADATTLGLAAFAIVLLFGVIAPRHTTHALRRITTFKVPGVEVGLSEIKRAERVRPLPREDDGVEVGGRPITGDPQAEYKNTVARMESRLRFAWDILGLGEDVGVKKEAYISIVEHLREKTLLSRDEEEFIADLLGAAHLQLDEWSAETREEFLDSTWEFATRFGPLIWDRYVRWRLEAAGWIVADYQQQRGHRPDFLACRGKRWAVMAARVAGTQRNPAAYGGSRERLRDFRHQELVSGRRIVIPDIRRAEGGDESVKVITLAALLSDPACAFD